jgi:ribonuclease BN (tRNA processing enzyme)
MKITILGSGTIIPTPKKKNKPQRSYSSIHIKFKSEDLLLDAGPGTLVKLQSLGINTQLNPDRLFITHYHIDHTGDYPALAKSRCFNLKKENQMIKLVKKYAPKTKVDIAYDLMSLTL